MSKQRSKSVAPPRLLLGVALLFWGGVTGHPIVGLVCAFLVEARWWVDLRWNTREEGFVWAWHLAVVLLVLLSAWFWLVDSSVRLFDLLRWMPVLFLPVILAQQYSTLDKMALNTFSLVARRKMRADRVVGRVVDPIMVHVGYAYFCLVLVASTFGQPDETVAFVGLTILAAVALFFASPVGRRRPISWAVALLVVTAISFAGVVAMQRLFTLLSGAAMGFTGADGTGSEARTAIGSLSEIKRSYKIRWRVSGEGVKPFSLFRTASYNRYGQGIWTHRAASGLSRALDYDEMIEGGDDFEHVWVFDRADLMSSGLLMSQMQVRGEANTVTPLPLPETTQALRGLEVQGVTWNPLGTVVAENPRHSVISFGVVLGENGRTEGPPDDALDFYTPRAELDGLRRTCKQLGLYDLSDLEKIETLRGFFRNKFRYTLDLQQDGALSGPSAIMAITRFLESTRAGHCEYYATATALLLREAGLPARYTEGFSAQERDLDRDEWLLRGAHAHAWCRAYVGGTREVSFDDSGQEEVRWTGGRWVDVDITPPAWFGLEGSRVPWQRIFLDGIQRLREDFLVWRTRPANRLIVDGIMISIAVLLVLYVVARVWGKRTRRRRAEIAGFRALGDVPVTPLHGLERVAEPLLGHRPAGMTLTRWLRGLVEVMPGEEGQLAEAMLLHWKLRFDPQGGAERDRDQLDRLCRDLRRSLKAQRRRALSSLNPGASPRSVSIR